MKARFSSTAPVQSVILQYIGEDLPELQDEIEKILRDNGFTMHWIPIAGFNSGAGNMHCNTNTVRRP